MTTDRVICPACQREGQTSTVWAGPTEVHLMHYEPFYDEQGRQHMHNPNKHGTSYACSRGHCWTRMYYEPCPTCGWKAGKDAVRERENR